VVDEPWREPLDETWARLDREAGGGPIWSGELKVTGQAGRLPSRLAAAAVLRALAAQASRGGTLFRELARTGQLLLSQPRGEAVTAAVAAADGDPGAWLTRVGSAEGPVTVVRPLGQLNGLELAWSSPLTQYGSDPPTWR
jgi:hypothetical protein